MSRSRSTLLAALLCPLFCTGQLFALAYDVSDGSPDVSLRRVLKPPSRVSVQEETSVPRSVVRAEAQG